MRRWGRWSGLLGLHGDGPRAFLGTDAAPLAGVGHRGTGAWTRILGWISSPGIVVFHGSRPRTLPVAPPAAKRRDPRRHARDPGEPLSGPAPPPEWRRPAEQAGCGQRAIEPEETHARSNRGQVDLRLRRGIARHARTAGREGRRHRGDDARARPRPRARGVHDHHRGMRGVHAGRPPPPDGLADAVAEAVGRLEERAGKRLGDPEDPLLVSVRSGARDRCPG